MDRVPARALSLAVGLQTAGCASSDVDLRLGRGAAAAPDATGRAAAPAAPAMPVLPTDRAQPGSARRPERPGGADAAEAAWNMRVVSNTPPSEKFVGATNSDLAFTGNYAIQGNYNGYQVWDISNPARPTLAQAYRLPRVAERRLGLQEPAVRLG